jgi:oligosaccharide repeat unit polymerase
MTIPQIISLIILVFLLIMSIKKNSDLFSPAKLFLIVWAFCIFLVEFKFSGFQHEWSLYSWFVLLLGVASTLLGIFISYVLSINTPSHSKNSLRDVSPTIEVPKLRKLYNITLLLFFLYLSSYIIEVLIEGNVPLFSPRMDRARIDFGIFGFHLLVNLQLTIMFLNIEYIVLAKKLRITGHETKIMWIIFVSNIANVFTSVTKI